MDGNVLETGYRLFLCMTGALIAVLLVRLPLRYAFGARIAYLIWLLVPIAVLGVVAGSFAPIGVFTSIALPVQVSAVRLPWPPMPMTPSSSGQMSWVIIGWVFGASLFASVQWWQQYAFVRRLGVLRRMPNGIWMSESADIGPAVVGVFPPRMVLPTDFYQRFTVPEQTFALAHESMHILRRDPLANGIVVIVRSLFWFHPLVHLTVRYFHIDQEFACDADVLGVQAEDRHHYARAILKGQLGGPALPAGCRLDSHAATCLKRRMLMLKRSLPSRRRRVLGAVAIGLSVIVGGGLACAASTDATDGSSQPGLRKAMHRHAPIVIVDGVRLETTDGTSPIDRIDPNTIRTIEVLQGSSTAKRYGPDAVNGVILITSQPRFRKRNP